MDGGLVGLPYGKFVPRSLRQTVHLARCGLACPCCGEPSRRASALKVREICQHYRLIYTTGPIWEQVGSAWVKPSTPSSFRLSWSGAVPVVCRSTGSQRGRTTATPADASASPLRSVCP